MTASGEQATQASGTDSGAEPIRGTGDAGPHGICDVTIDKWVYGGEGLGRIDGRVVLAPFVLPGEVARIDMKDDIHASLVEVIQPAPERIPARCAVFTQCGGCQYQHAPYEFQVARKVEILREQLRRVGKIEYSGEIETITGPEYGYRNRAQFHIENGRIGYRAGRSHTLVPLLADCPISSPKVNETLALLRDRMRDKRFPKFLKSVEVFTDETNIQLNVLETERPVAQVFFSWFGSVLELPYQTSAGSFRVNPKSFFQVNRFLIDRLVQAATADATGGHALDLYAGVGLFSIPLASKCGNVLAVESGPTAFRDMAFNAKQAGVALTGVRERVEEFIVTHKERTDFVLADPPRAGLGKTVTTHLERLKPARITIVSCDPATLARDLSALKSYQIDRMTLVDLFPQTYHMETVVALTRK